MLAHFDLVSNSNLYCGEYVRTVGHSMYIYELAHPNRIPFAVPGKEERSEKLFAYDLSAVRALTGIIKSHIKQELSHLLMLSGLLSFECF